MTIKTNKSLYKFKFSKILARFCFRQLIHGNEVLKVIENVSTYYESPKNDIRIKSCGEFSLCPDPDQKCIDELEKYLESVEPATGLHPDIVDLRDKVSVLDIRRFKKGCYSPELDMQSHLPFLHLPDYLLSYLSVAIKEDIQRGQSEGKNKFR